LPSAAGVPPHAVPALARSARRRIRPIPAAGNRPKGAGHAGPRGTLRGSAGRRRLKTCRNPRCRSPSTTARVTPAVSGTPSASAAMRSTCAPIASADAVSGSDHRHDSAPEARPCRARPAQIGGSGAPTPMPPLTFRHDDVVSGQLLQASCGRVRRRRHPRRCTSRRAWARPLTQALAMSITVSS
jgi:hypothetical protein